MAVPPKKEQPNTPPEHAGHPCTTHRVVLEQEAELRTLEAREAEVTGLLTHEGVKVPAEADSASKAAPLPDSSTERKTPQAKR